MAPIQVAPLFSLAAPDDVEEETSDVALLHRISVELIGEQDLGELYSKIVAAAVTITQSQFGTMQRLCPPGDPSGHGGELQLLAHCNLPPEALEFWRWVSPAAHSSCTMALRFVACRVSIVSVISAKRLRMDFLTAGEMIAIEASRVFRRLFGLTQAAISRVSRAA